MNQISVLLETGSKRVIASAADWPGWCRGERSETAALQTLGAYQARYARVLQAAGVDISFPSGPVEFVVKEHLQGNSTTDFGVPVIVAAEEREPLDPAGVTRSRSLLLACWQALETAAREAAGKELRKGPRGGGRDLERIVSHVQEAELSYLGTMGFKPPQKAGSAAEAFQQIRQAVQSALEAASRGELPTQGPRGGKIWPARYYVRRSAWHILDHVWEIEDRL